MGEEAREGGDMLAASLDSHTHVCEDIEGCDALGRLGGSRWSSAQQCWPTPKRTAAFTQSYTRFE